MSKCNLVENYLVHSWGLKLQQFLLSGLIRTFNVLDVTYATIKFLEQNMLGWSIKSLFIEEKHVNLYTIQVKLRVHVGNSFLLFGIEVKVTFHLRLMMSFCGERITGGRFQEWSPLYKFIRYLLELLISLIY